MVLINLKQILLNFNTFNRIKVGKCLQMTKTKHLRKVQQNWKKAIFCTLFCDFFERGYHKTKSECARKKSRRSFKLENWMTNIFIYPLFKWYWSAFCWFWIIQESVPSSVRNLVKYIYLPLGLCNYLSHWYKNRLKYHINELSRCIPVVIVIHDFGWLCWGLTSQSTIFQSCRDGAIASWVINQYFRGVKCLAQGHNTAAVGLEPRTSRSGVRHSTTEPPRSPVIHDNDWTQYVCYRAS